MSKQSSDKRKTPPKTKQGFTLIEVMLVLGLTGLLLLGTLGGTFAAISSQRYNDSVRSFAEYLRTIYSEVISPESLKLESGDNSAAGREDRAILGKIIIFGADNTDPADGNRLVYSATIDGEASLSTINSLDATADLKEVLKQVEPRIRCDTKETYLPTWGAELTNPTSGNKFSGSVVIIRSPSSGVVQTRFQANNYSSWINTCSAGGTQPLDYNSLTYGNLSDEDIGFCVKSGNTNSPREVIIAKNGRNTSAVSILNVDDDSSDAIGEKGTCK